MPAVRACTPLVYEGLSLYGRVVVRAGDVPVWLLLVFYLVKEVVGQGGADRGLDDQLVQWFPFKACVS